MQSCMNLNNDNLIILINRFRLQNGFNDYSLFTAFTNLKSINTHRIVHIHNLDHINIKNRNL